MNVTPWLPGSALKASWLSSSSVNAEEMRGRHEIPGSVQRTDQGEEFACRISESGHGPGRLVGLLTGLR